MSRGGYLVLLVILLALALFVFWPGGYRSQVSVYPGPAQARFVVDGYGYRQEVDGAVMTLVAASHTWRRAVDRTRAAELWRLLHRLRVDPRAIRADVAADDLSAYGITEESPRLNADGIDLRWGSVDGRGFVYDALRRRVIRLPQPSVERLDERCRRLDHPGLLGPEERVAALTAGAVQVAARGRQWVDPQAAGRPAFSARAGDLVAAVQALPLRAPGGVEPVVDERLAGSLRLDAASDDRRWVLGQAADGAWRFALGDLPVQPLEESEAWRLLQAQAELEVDRLFAFRDTVLGNPIVAATVYRGDRSWFRVERTRDEDDWHGESSWEMIHEGVRIRAPSGSAYMLAEALNALAVTDWSQREPPRPWQPPDASEAMSILIDLGKRVAYLVIDGDTVVTAGYQAQVVELPDLLDDLRPDRFIDLQIHNIERTRLTKVQRIGADVAEVIAFDRDRGWERVYPERGPVAAGAMEQLLVAIAHLRADSARLPTAADAAILADPDLEIDVRIAPQADAAAGDDLRIEQTIERDWGLALGRDGALWRAVDKDAGLSYGLEARRVEELFRPLDRPVLLPLVPTQVMRLVIEREDGTRYRLQRRGNGWWLESDDYQGAADETQVRRYLFELAAASFVEEAAAAAAVVPADRLGGVQIALPGVDGDGVVWRLDFGREDGDLLRASVVRSLGGDTGQLRGVYRVHPGRFERSCPDPRSLAPVAAP